jgi:hypothetical protein
VDLGGEKRLSEVAVDWEFPAKAFTVSVSTDGAKWSEVFATDSNILSSNNIALGAVPAAKVRVTMREACHAASDIRDAAGWGGFALGCVPGGAWLYLRWWG